MPKLEQIRFISVFIFLVGLLALPFFIWQTFFVGSHFSINKNLSSISLTPPTPPQITSPLIVPIYTGDQTVDQTFPVASTSAVYIMDRQSGSILYQRNSQEAHFPASVTKMMTALVARQTYPLDTTLQIKEEAFATGSTAHFKVGENMTVQNLLEALLIPSGNDAAFVLANHHPMGYAGFVDQMNQMGTGLHLEHTHFQNPSGLDDDQQETTARDLAILANQVMKDDVLRQIVGKRQADISDVTGKIKHHLINTQELLGVVPGVVGIKTGTTNSAGENLITEVDRDGHQVIIVLLGSQNRYNETTAIIEWVFSHYTWQTIGPGAE